MFKKLNHSFLEQALKRAGIHKQVEGILALDVATEILQKRFGEGFHVHVKPAYVKNRMLALEVEHPAISQEIAQQSESIISEINDRLGRPEITTLQFILPRNNDEFISEADQTK